MANAMGNVTTCSDDCDECDIGTSRSVDRCIGAAEELGRPPPGSVQGTCV